MRQMKITFDVGDIDDMLFLILQKNEHLQTFWSIDKYYEEDLIKFIQDNYKGGIFIDVGACIGNHTLAFSKIADKVVSFEPHKQSYWHTLNNIYLNNLENVMLFNLALGNKTGLEFLHHDNMSAGGGTISKEGKEIVPIHKLDEFCFSGVTLIKIDVQRYEMEVLKGSIETIKKNLPDIVAECDEEEQKTTILTFLQAIDNKYVIYPEKFNNSPTYLFTRRLK